MHIVKERILCKYYFIS